MFSMKLVGKQHTNWKLIACFGCKLYCFVCIF